jgi:oligopeptide transport system permease protein
MLLRYIARRLAIALVAIFVLATVTFFLMRLVPGDPFAGPRVAPEIRAALREHYGLNLPLIQQYWIYMSNLLHGDLGLSLASRGHPVTDIIVQAAPVSIDLGIRAMILAITAGLFFGIVAALNRGTPLDYLTVVLVLIGVSIPSFVLAGVLQYYFGVYWHILPIARYESFWHTILPAFALSLGTMASIARYMRSSMLEVVHADYIKTAFAKGLTPSQVVWRHQVRNALFTILTILGPAVAQVLTGSFVVETIFAIPGLGRYFVTAMQNLDYTLVMGMTIFFGTFLILMNFLVDVAYGLIDPRIRLS